MYVLASLLDVEAKRQQHLRVRVIIMCGEYLQYYYTTIIT